MRSPVTLLTDAWNFFTSNAKLLIGIYLVPGVLAFLFTFVSRAYEAVAKQGDMPSLSLSALFFVSLVVVIVANVLMGIAMIKAIAEPQSTTIKSGYTFAKKLFWPYLWVAALVGLAIMGGLILLIIPGIIFMVWFGFSYFVLIFEDKRGTKAMKASRELVRGKWWAVFGRYAFLVLIVMLVSIPVGMLSAIGTAIGGEVMSGLLSTAVNFVMVPVSVTYAYYMYKDLSTGPIEEVVEAVTDVVTPDDTSAQSSATA